MNVQHDDPNKAKDRVIGAIGRKLGIDRPRRDRELCARSLVREAQLTGVDPLNLDDVLGTLVEAASAPLGTHHETLRNTYLQLSELERQRLRTYYKTTCSELMTEFSSLFDQQI
jgi:hypothetical protein